jgi:riboflavin transporter FmnP
MTRSTSTYVKIAVLGAISFVLMFFKAPLWFAPPFMKFDVSDLPSVLAAFTMGPVPGIWVQVIKNLLNILVEGSVTNGLGELTNFLVGSVLAFTAGFVYNKKRTFQGALLGLGVGVLVMVMFATFNNYYIMFPVYAKVFGLPLETLVGMGSAVNKYVVDYKTLMLFAVVPFNILKGLAVSLVVLFTYKKLGPILQR